MLTALRPTDRVPMLTALRPTDRVPTLTALDLTESMAFLTAPDPTAGRVEVPDKKEHLDLCSYHHVRGPGRLTATNSWTLETRIPNSGTTTKDESSRPNDRYCAPTRPLNDESRLPTSPLNESRLPTRPLYESRLPTSPLNRNRLPTIPSSRRVWNHVLTSSPDQCCLPTHGLAEERHLNLCPLARNHVLAAGPMATDEGWTSLSAPGRAEEKHLNRSPMAGSYVLAAAGPLAMDESCPSTAAPGSSEESYLNRGLATLGHAASAPVPTDGQSLTTAGSAAISPCQCLLRSSTAHPMGSVIQLLHPLYLLHRHALRVSLVLIQGPRMRS